MKARDMSEADDTVETPGAKILVVDDEEIIRMFLDRVLTDEGHQVDVVDNGTEALEKIRNGRYGLIMLDMKMPGMSGTEVYKQIRLIDKSIIARVVFVTGDIMGADTAAFLEKTKAPYVTKPFDAVQLKKQIKHLLNR